MRVISGKYRGVKINTVDSDDFRPTTGRTKEALFSILTSGQFLQEDGSSILDGADIIELFCGTGAISIEALSRGANFAHMIDKNPDHLNIAKSNIEKLNASKDASLMRCDLPILPKAKKSFDIAFIDPPYNSNLIALTLKNLYIQGWMKPSSLIIIETSKKEEVAIPEWAELADERMYGKSKISFLMLK